MTHRSTSLTLLALAVLFAASAVGAGLPSKKDRWSRAQTEHFTIYGNADARTLSAIAGDLERLRAVLGQLFDVELKSPKPTHIYVFKDDKSFRPYKPLYKGKPARLSGYFQSARDGNYVALDGTRTRGRQRDASSVMYHEYLHYVLRNNHPGLPVWMNEGLAELYSTFEADDEHARIGRPVEAHIHWLRNNPLIPLRDLMAIDHTSEEYNEGSRRGVFYAQSWALVHYLYVGAPERKGQGASYARLLAAGKSRDEAFAAAFGDPEALETELKRYVRGRAFSFVKLAVGGALELAVGEALEPAAGKALPIDVEVSPMSRPELLYRLGDLLAHSSPDHVVSAEQHFRAALALAPERGDAYAGLGMLEEERGDAAAAAALYRKAVELTPDDGTANYRLGSLEVEQLGQAGRSESDLDAGERARLAAALAALRRSVELRPQLANAWARLGYGYTILDEPPPEAVAALERAHRELPDRDDVTFNLALLHGRVGSKPRARQLLMLLVRDADDETAAASARSALVRIEISHAFDVARDDRFEEAIAGLEEARGRTPEGERESLDDALRELRDVAQQRSFARKYNEAVEQINQGELLAAIELANVLVAEAGTEEHKAAANALLEQLTAARK